MKKLRVLTLAAITFLTSTAFAHEGHYSINTGSTTIEWLGEKVTGEHKGMISAKKGDLHFDGDELTKVYIVMDMTSMTCTDIENAEYNAKLIGHLESDDFFSTANNPEATFTSTAVNLLDAKTGKYEVTGNMIIKGKSHEQKFEVIAIKEGDKVSASAKIVINRTDYNVKYGSKSFFEGLGDKVIYDDFTLTVKMVANKQ
jgi:polyisoprenoid-binding protein YceI